MTTLEIIKKTKAAWGSIANASADEKNAMLLSMADALEDGCADIFQRSCSTDSVWMGSAYAVWRRESAPPRRCPTTPDG